MGRTDVPPIWCGPGLESALLSSQLRIEMVRNRLWMLVIAFGFVGCTPVQLRPGWVSQLPSRNVQLVVFMYPARGIDAPPDDEVLAVQESIRSELMQELRDRGLVVRSDLQGLRRTHVYIWGGGRNRPGPSAYTGFLSPYHEYAGAAAATWKQVQANMSANENAAYFVICGYIDGAKRIGTEAGILEFTKPVSFLAEDGGAGRVECPESKRGLGYVYGPELRLLGVLNVSSESLAAVKRGDLVSFSTTESLTKLEFGYESLSPQDWGKAIVSDAMSKIPKE